LPSVLEFTRNLGLDALKIVGMYPFTPEISILKIFVWGVTEQSFDIGANKGRRKIAACFETIDHRWGSPEQLRQPLPRVGLYFLELLLPNHFTSRGSK
jgi:hypothetical protein